MKKPMDASEVTADAAPSRDPGGMPKTGESDRRLEEAQGGLGLEGIAPGGGGSAAPADNGLGYGSGHGRLGGAHKSSPPEPPPSERPDSEPFPSGGPALALQAPLGGEGETTRSELLGLDGKAKNELAKELAAGDFDRSGGLEQAIGSRRNQAYQVNVDVSVAIGDRLLRHRFFCSGAANAPLAERLSLWRERLARTGGNPNAVASVYRGALARCEAPGPRERTLLLSLLLDALPTPSQRVALWRLMQRDLGAADALYRGLLARVRTADEARALASALGLRAAPLEAIEAALKDVDDPAARVAKLRALASMWPDDHELAMRLLDAMEDAGDASAARLLGKKLRRRADVDARVRTTVGELHLRLAAAETDPARKAAEEQEARRAFGEIVEFAPDDPAARRRLGDLLRSHGWFEEAARQYETLAVLVPDDPGVALLRAAAAEGLGKLEEAIKWAELGAQSGPPDATTGPAATARAVAATYLAWGQLTARQEGKADLEQRLAARKGKFLRATAPGEGSRVRITIGWAHPDLHPTLWSDVLGAAMPATEGDATLGVAQIDASARAGGWIEIRLDQAEVERVARLGAEIDVLFAWGEGAAGERLLRKKVKFTRGGRDRLRFSIESGEPMDVPAAAGERR